MLVYDTDAGDVVSVRGGFFGRVTRLVFCDGAHKEVAAKYAQILTPRLRYLWFLQNFKRVEGYKSKQNKLLSNLLTL